MLTEPQIQRFSRQILLREVGGVGQARLLATPVHIAGVGISFDVARATLAAGGSAFDAAARWVVGSENADVLIGAARVASGCRQCLASLPAEVVLARPDLSVLLGSLAALATQRLILGLAKRVDVAEWADGRLHTWAAKCPHSP
jgi:hypothetical protein